MWVLGWTPQIIRIIFFLRTYSLWRWIDAVVPQTWIQYDIWGNINALYKFNSVSVSNDSMEDIIILFAIIWIWTWSLYRNWLWLNVNLFHFRRGSSEDWTEEEPGLIHVRFSFMWVTFFLYYNKLRWYSLPVCFPHTGPWSPTHLTHLPCVQFSS